MKVNAGKTELLMCGDRRQLVQIGEPPQIEVVGELLPLSKTVKDLGVSKDSELSWEPQIDKIIKRCSGILIGLSHIKHIIPLHILPRIVDAWVLSYVRYCAAVLGSANRTNLARLQTVLNFSARLISEDGSMTTFLTSSMALHGCVRLI